MLSKIDPSSKKKMARMARAFVPLAFATAVAYLSACGGNSSTPSGLANPKGLAGGTARPAVPNATVTDGLPPFPTYVNSVWTRPVPSPNPPIDANSSTWLSYYFGGGKNGTFLPENFDIKMNGTGNTYQDYHLPYYWTTTSDSSYTIQCPFMYGKTQCYSLTEYGPVAIPPGAKYGSYPAPHCAGQSECPASGFDAHVAFFSPDGSAETDIEGGSALYGLGTGTVLSVGGADNIAVASSNGFDERSNVSGTGFIGAATASRRLLGAGVILPSELTSNGGIKHAIPIQLQCVLSGAGNYPVYPYYGGTACSSGGAPIGAWLWLDMSDTAIHSERMSAGFDAGTERILLALAHYGGFVVDTLGVSSGPEFGLSYALPSPFTWTDRSETDPYPAVASSLGLSLNTGAYTNYYQLNLALFPQSLLSANLKVLDPCILQGSCSRVRGGAKRPGPSSIRSLR